MTNSLVDMLDALRKSNPSGDAEKLFEEALQRVVDERAKEISWNDPHKIINRARELKQRYIEFIERQDFQPGQLVRWKAGMKNKRKPEYNEPAIVVEVLSEPVMENSANPGSAYFREKLDIILAVIDTDNDFLVFHYDSRRFELVRQ